MEIIRRLIESIELKPMFECSKCKKKFHTRRELISHYREHWR